MKNKYTCLCCGFKTIERFNSQEICSICMWQSDYISDYFPLIWWWPNDDLYSEQQKIIIKIPTNIKEIKSFNKSKQEMIIIKRSPNWKPIDIKNIKYRDKPYIEKWYYKDIVQPYYKDLHKNYFEEAQKYNPTDY